MLLGQWEAASAASLKLCCVPSHLAYAMWQQGQNRVQCLIPLLATKRSQPPRGQCKTSNKCNDEMGTFKKRCYPYLCLWLSASLRRSRVSRLFTALNAQSCPGGGGCWGGDCTFSALQGVAHKAFLQTSAGNEGGNGFLAPLLLCHNHTSLPSSWWPPLSLIGWIYLGFSALGSLYFLFFFTYMT